MTAGGLKRRQGVLDAASQHSGGVRGGLELDCGKLWRRKSLGTGVYRPVGGERTERLRVHQSEDPWPEDPWEVRERLLVTRGR